MSEHKHNFEKKLWEPLTKETYRAWYKQSIEKPDEFWDLQAKRFITWEKTWDKVKQEDLINGNVAWFQGAQLNVCYNCIDRHLEQNAKKAAIIWEPDSPDQKTKVISYQELHDRVCQISNLLKQQGIKKGMRVCIYLPMIPEAAMCMLACARIGAVHSVVFAGFSAQSLRNRIEDAKADLVITTDGLVRGGKHLDTKAQVDEAIEGVTCVNTVLVIKNTDTDVTMQTGRDVWFTQQADKQAKTCEPEKMEAEDPLFILYTSGSTGQPKGVLHTQGGYITYAAMTFRYVFDYQPDDIYWCTADVGWITGHTYLVYGPFAMGATNVMFEGVPNYPTPSRCWEIIDKHKVSIFYTAPTAIRALMAQGNEYVESTSRASLRVLGTVGEPINPEAWRWYHDVVGKGQLPIVDTWWQTETGGIMIAPLINISKQSPGSAGLPFFGVDPKIVEPDGQPAVSKKGRLVLNQSWPGMARTIFNNHPRYVEQYLSQVPGCYFTGDGCYTDSESEYWITGRVDDVINVSGHRLGTAEIESALVVHRDVAEAAVVGISDDIKGQNIYAFVTLNHNLKFTEELKSELKDIVKEQIGKIAIPKNIQWAPSLPKTRSGKIMRRVLRLIAQDEFDQLGDLSTLADQSVVENLISGKKAMHSTSMV